MWEAGRVELELCECNLTIYQVSNITTGGKTNKQTNTCSFEHNSHYISLVKNL